jgi:type I restriction enzyme S subunit
MHIGTGSRNTEHRVDNGKYPFFVRSQQVEQIDDYNYDCEAVLTAGDGVGTGKVYHYINGKFDAHQRVYVMSQFSGIDGKYFYYSFSNNFLSEVEKYTAKSSVDSVRRNMIANMEILLPPLPEQRLIATALSDADAYIAALEKLLTKKRAIKQGAMQELLTGKRRLPGFSGEWEEKALGEALKVGHGKSQREIEIEGGGYPILATGGEIGRTNTFLYDKASVLIGRKGTIDKPQYMDTPFWTIDTLFYTIISDSANPKYLYYLFCTIDWGRLNEASGVPSLSASVIEKLQFVLPDKTEQTAIAAVLSDMDAEIDVLTAKLNKAKRIKQGMAQELLTGRIRLITGGAK